jgi:hypothetical protein
MGRPDTRVGYQPPDGSAICARTVTVLTLGRNSGPAGWGLGGGRPMVTRELYEWLIYVAIGMAALITHSLVTLGR